MSYVYLLWSLSFDPRRFAALLVADVVIGVAVIAALPRGGVAAGGASPPATTGESSSVAAIESKEKLLRLVREYGDLRFREGAAAGLADRDTSKQRRVEADKTLAKITEAMK